MANRIYFLPQRNDLDGMNVQVTDLLPNTSQKNSIYDGEGQTHYIGACLDVPGTTKVDGNVFLSGSRSTTLDANPALASTVGGGNDCYATTKATFGLAAYLRERVQKAGVGGTFLTFANANTLAVNIRSAASAGSALTLTSINALLAATGGGGTELTSAGGSKSFGTVDDILRILSGETYRSPIHTVITTAVPVFKNLAERQALVAVQHTYTTGLTYVAAGAFLTSLESGFVGRPVIAATGILLSSLGAGQLKALNQDIVLKNPAFTYGSSGNAFDINGTSHIPDNGDWPALYCYDGQGNKLA